MAGSSTTDLWGAEGALPVPADIKTHSMDMWCEFAVWGLVIYDEQTPWFTLIECINIFTHRHRLEEDPLPGLEIGPDGKPRHERQPYSMPLNTNLRHLLFRDQEISRLAALDDEQSVLWAKWLAATKRDFPHLDMEYLKNQFASFTQFAETVSLLRSSEIEPFATKRWTSRYLQPLGSAMLFPDVKMNQQESFQVHRLFFQRTGEILFMMLNRSSSRERLSSLLDERLIVDDRPWNKLAQKLQGPDAEPAQEQMVDASNIGYLPMVNLPRYDRLGEDWVALLEQSSIPIEDCLDYMMRMTGLNMVVYIIERAIKVLGKHVVPPFVLDLAGSARSNPIYGYSVEQYKIHKALPLRAVEAHIHKYASTDEWAELGSSPADRDEARKLLARRFLWTPKGPVPAANLETPEKQLEALLDKFKKRNHDVGSSFSSHARRIGLLGAVRRTGTWYCPSDAFIEALVLSNVAEPMELGQFLRRLYERYHILIGADQAESHRQVPRSAMKENERRMEERLRVLGFIDRKSDDCAFVINPFYKSGKVANAERQYESA